jgi:regulator of protease activity HflC (stomatin/prohibitin superfamily)
MNYDDRKPPKTDTERVLEFVQKHRLKLVLWFVLIFVVNKPWYTVRPGQVAIRTRFGKIVSVDRQGGLFYKTPFIERVTYLNTRIVKAHIETNSLSKDLQFVSIGIAINYQIDDALLLYREIGNDYEKVVIDPLAQESIKAVVARYTAEQLIQHRHEAKDAVLTDIKERLLPRYITLIDCNFTHLDFHQEFMNAVESKQIAQQAAMTSHNLTEKVREEMQQKKLKIDMDAYELKVLRDQTTPLLLELKKIEKWDGKLPRLMGAGSPLISFNNP